jgi:phosphatidate cytidylyltransferase
MALPGRKVVGAVLSGVGALLPLLFIWHSGDYFLAALTVATLGIALIFLFSIDDLKASAPEFALAVSGLLYVPLLLGHLVLTRELPHGIQWIFLLLILVMSGDTGAYYVGSSLGRHKLYPLVSPNKSIEGAVGGLAGSLLGVFSARWIFFPELTVVDCLLTALIIGSLGQMGDLFESLLKRSFGVKDSGTIIPGHGGILDRLDSILFAAPAMYYYVVLRGIL